MGLVPIVAAAMIFTLNFYLIGMFLGLMGVMIAHYLWSARGKPHPQQPEEIPDAELVLPDHPKPSS